MFFRYNNGVMNILARTMKVSDISFRSVWRNPFHFIACGFGIGTLPMMPGTFGTAFGVMVYLLMAQLSLTIYLIITLLLVLAGIYLCGKVNRDFGTEDHPAAVWDEIASFPIVMIAIPRHWYFVLMGFVLFRFFDIRKPWPIRWLDQHIHGGVGVMLDDVVAALFSWAILFVMTLLLGY